MENGRLARAPGNENVARLRGRPDEASGTTWHCDGRTFEFFRKEVSKGREGGSQRSFSFFSLFARSFISFSRAIFTIPLASS